MEQSLGRSEEWGQEITWPALHGAFEEWSKSRLRPKQIGVATVLGSERSHWVSAGKQTLGWHLKMCVFLSCPTARPLAKLRVLSDLRGSGTLGQGEGTAGWWVCCLLSSAWRRTGFGTLDQRHFLRKCRLNFVVWFDGLEKIQPTNQTSSFPHHTFHSAFSWYIYQGNGIFFNFCVWKRSQLISSYKGIPSLTSRRFRSVNVSSPHSWTFVFTLDGKEASSQMSVQMSVSQVVVLVPFPWLWFFCFVLFLTSSQCCSPFF